MAKKISLVLAALVLAAASLYLRSQSGQTAQAKAATIIAADAAGSDTTASLAELKSYAHAHMGASVSLNLNGAYARAEAAAKASAAASAVNSQIYADAQRLCGGKSDSITQARCNQDYLAKHLANLPLPTPVVAPKAADYHYDFHSPVWTPDLAGVLSLAALAVLLAGIVALIRRGRHGR